MDNHRKRSRSSSVSDSDIQRFLEFQDFCKLRKEQRKSKRRPHSISPARHYESQAYSKSYAHSF